MASSSGTLFCFNKSRRERGHYFSYNDLYRAGIWVGYLAASKQHLQFEGLPSFSELKSNRRLSSLTYQDGLHGSACEKQYALCGCCLSRSSQLIYLEVITYVENLKLVIMPLDSPDDEGMFCILHPIPSDGTLRGLQEYRAYEYLGDGQGMDSTSNISILTLNFDGISSGTLEMVCAVSAIPTSSISDSIHRSNSRSTRSQSMSVSSNSQSGDTAMHHDKRRKLAIKGSFDGQLARNRRNQLSTPQIKRSNPKRGTSVVSSPANEGASVANTLAVPRPPLSQMGPSIIPPDTTNVALELTKEQTRRVRIVWLVKWDEADYEFGHSLAECETFATFLSLLRDDVEDISETLDTIESSKMWRLIVQIPDTAKKVFTVRVGDDTAFERLQLFLAQSSFWQNNTKSKIDVEARIFK